MTCLAFPAGGLAAGRPYGYQHVFGGPVVCQELELELEEEEKEEEVVGGSYMGDELDLKTVGDIIAIIEEKVTTIIHRCLEEHRRDTALVHWLCPGSLVSHDDTCLCLP